ncbi:probable cytochrome P450 CYP44 [Ruditapes philippinarum]|uniref:probable cytochrome P450 CYP44 n=1 Tax=Ruditapes philippinarum TaxID=129788 RepID=UPI00295A7BDA|nr:probable cytochrome P450 CYP44 [Ruditapes philippinarum]
MKTLKSVNLLKLQKVWRSTASTTVESAGCLRTEYDKAKPFDDIPGPKGLPYIGTMLKYRRAMSATQKHLLKFPSLNNTKQNRLKGNPKDLFFFFGLGNTNGDEWYKLRSAVQQMMMRPKAVTVYLPFVTEVADDFIERLKNIRDDSGRVENLRNEISKWNVESVLQYVSQRRLNCLSDGPDSEVQKMIDANMDMFTLSAKMKFQLPLYKVMKTPTWKKLCQAEECVYKTSEKYLNQTISRISNLARNNELEEGQYNFLTYLLGKQELDNKDVTIIALSLFGDGLSTTSPTLSSNLYCLGRYQDAQEKVYQEIQRVVPPGSQITAEIINKMSYLKAFVKEAFRFFPIGLDVARIPQQNLSIGGYQIPAGTHVELNNFVMFKDEKYFDEPDEFRAERWLRDGSAENIHPYILTPFGHGPRMCAGRRFAEQEMYVVIIKLLQNFRLEWRKSSDLGQKYQILMVPDAPVDVVLHNRK